MQLRQYLYDRDIPAACFAERIGVSVQAVHRYINGDRTPRRDVMERIRVATRGAVQPNDFFRQPVAA